MSMMLTRLMVGNLTYVTEFTKSLLDVCITSNPENIVYSGILHLGISDHSLIYAIRKINAKPITESQGYVEFRNFKKFKVSNFLNDLYGVPWEEINSMLMECARFEKHYLLMCLINLQNVNTN